MARREDFQSSNQGSIPCSSTKTLVIKAPLEVAKKELEDFLSQIEAELEYESPDQFVDTSYEINKIMAAMGYNVPFKDLDDDGDFSEILSAIGYDKKAQEEIMDTIRRYVKKKLEAD